jgi:hypothetical protein
MGLQGRNLVCIAKRKIRARVHRVTNITLFL